MIDRTHIKELLGKVVVSYDKESDVLLIKKRGKVVGRISHHGVFDAHGNYFCTDTSERAVS